MTLKRRHRFLNHPFVAHFITTTIVSWVPVFSVAAIAEETLKIFERYRVSHDIICLGFVLMPHHFHVLLFSDEDGTDISDLMRDFKKASSAGIRRQTEAGLGSRVWLDTFREIGAKYHPSRPRMQVWMDRYDDVAVNTMQAIRTKIEYMHGNPVRASLSQSPEAYPYCSAGDFAGNPNAWIAVDAELARSAFSV